VIRRGSSDIEGGECQEENPTEQATVGGRWREVQNGGSKLIGYEKGVQREVGSGRVWKKQSRTRKKEQSNALGCRGKH